MHIRDRLQTRQTKIYALNIQEQHFAHAMRVDVFKSRYIPRPSPTNFHFLPSLSSQPQTTVVELSLGSVQNTDNLYLLLCSPRNNTQLFLRPEAQPV